VSGAAHLIDVLTADGKSRGTKIVTRPSRPRRLWQCVRDQLRTVDTAHRDDEVLLAVDYVGGER
jgi:hypothetical protein